MKLGSLRTVSEVIQKNGVVDVRSYGNDIKSIFIKNAGDETMTVMEDFTISPGDGALELPGYDYLSRYDYIRIEFDGTGTNPKAIVLIDVVSSPNL